MEEVIVYKDRFESEIDNLLEVLFINEYFGFEDSALTYVEKIYDFIKNNISKPISKNSPLYYQKFGKKFIRYKANNTTSWYIFFDQRDNKFLVNHIINNHSQDFPELF
ncbi:hypothetical protein [Chryseobacterium sp. GP-SGM7]|uniref:hypothetical protein n=1 Tax=Chryseobacterium sp. GP-SGM7 TaxID=3411323 RepID=UPI003B929DC7